MLRTAKTTGTYRNLYEELLEPNEIIKCVPQGVIPSEERSQALGEKSLRGWQTFFAIYNLVKVCQPGRLFFTIVKISLYP